MRSVITKSNFFWVWTGSTLVQNGLQIESRLDPNWVQIWSLLGLNATPNPLYFLIINVWTSWTYQSTAFDQVLFSIETLVL